MNFKKEIFYLILIVSAFVLFFPKLSLAAPDFDLSVSGSCIRSQPQAVLTWQAVAGTPSYQIWKSENGGLWSNIGSTTSLSYIDKNIYSDRRYDYQIKIVFPVDQSDVERLDPLYCPPYLNDPSAYCQSDGPRISLSWDAISGNLNIYNIWRAKDGGDFSILTSTVSTSSIDGPNIYGASQYSYKIEAIWANGVSTSSSVLTEIALACPPTLNYATTCLQNVEPGGPRVNLSWNELLGVQEYDIYQTPPGTTIPVRIATTTAISYSDNLVESLPNTYYQNGTVSYYVQAVWASTYQDSSTKQVSIFPCPPFLRVDGVCAGPYMHLYWTATLGTTNYSVYRGIGINPPNTYIGSPSPATALYFDNPVSSPSSYTYKVRAVASPVNQDSNFVSKDIDCSVPAPDPPPHLGNPTVMCVPGDSLVTNSWESSNNVSYYRLLRDGGGIYNGTDTSYTDGDGQSGYTYNYSVIAFGQSGETNSDNNVNATFLDCTEPNTPNLATTTGCDQGRPYAYLSWNLTDHTYNYEVWRREQSTEFVLKKTLDPTVIEWTDNVNIATSTRYYYKVVAKGFPGVPSKESNIEPVDTGLCYPTLPVLTLSKKCNVAAPIVRLTWNTDGVNTDHFDIYRQDFSTTIPIANPGGSVREWEDSSVGNKVSYQYKIVAVGYLGQKTSTNYQPITSWYCAPPGSSGFTLNVPTISCPSGSYSYPQSDLSWGSSLEAIQYRLNRYLFSGNSVSETTTVVATITSPYKDRGYGNVLSFSGDDYVGFGSSPSLNNLAALTIEFWAKSNSTNSYIGVLGTGQDWNSSGTSFYFRDYDPNDTRRFSFTVTAGVTYANVRWGTYENGQYQYGRWYHVVGTYDGTTVRLYVDGQFKNSVNTSGTVVNSDTLKIGDAGTQIGNFKGEIDNVRIYAKAIPQSLITQHYNGDYSLDNAACGGDCDLRGAWLFDEGTGGAGAKVSDSSNYGNNGTLFGTPVWVKNGPQSGGKYNWQMLAYSHGSVPTFSATSSSSSTMPYCAPIKSGLVLTPDCAGALAVMNLSWSFSHNATSFQVWREGAPTNPIKTFLTSDPEFSSRTWTDNNGGSGLNQNTNYTYWIKSVGGNGSTDSDHLIKKTPSSCSAPSAPLSVQADFSCATTSDPQFPQVLLTWLDVGGADYYEIFRKGESYKNNIYATSFFDVYPYVLASSSYYYSVVSHNVVGSSPLSVSSTIFVDYCKATIPTTSVSTYCSPTTSQPINEINWKDNTFFNSAEYRIWRRDPNPNPPPDSFTYLIGTVSEADSFAYKPPGWSSQASCSNSPSLENLSQQLTVEFWMKPNERYTGYAVRPMTKWTGTSDATFALYYFGQTEGTDNGKIVFYGSSSGWRAISPKSISALPLGEWRHIVLSYASSTGGRLYINGVSQGSPVGSGLLATNTASLAFGLMKNGLIDEVRIYNRALGAAEIGEHYNKTYNDERGLKAHWRLNEGIGNNMMDISGFANNCLVANGLNAWQKLIASDPTYSLTGPKFAARIRKFIDDGSLYTLNSSTNYNYWVEIIGQKGDSTSTYPLVSMLTYGCNLLPNPPTITATSTACFSPTEPYNTLSWTTTTNTLSSNIYRTGPSGASVFYTRLSSFQDKGSYALNFDGSAMGNVTIPDSSSIDGLNAVSVELWIYQPIGTPYDHTLLTDDWLILHNFRDESFHLRAQVGSCPNADSGYIGYGVTLTQGQWHHIVGTYDRYQVGNNMKLYLDGALRSEKEFRCGRLRNSGLNLQVNPGWTGTDPYSGLIDELRIYGRALSAAEVSEHFNNGTYKNELELRAALHFDEGTSTFAYDSSGRNNFANVSVGNGVSWLKINEASSFYNNKIHSLSLEENSLYSYQVKLAAQSRESNPSGTSITTSECGPWVRDFSATPRCSNGVSQIYLEWDSGNVVESYFFKEPAMQATTAIDGTEWPDSDVVPETEYNYYIEVKGWGGEVASSSPTSATAIFCTDPPEIPVITGATSSCYGVPGAPKIKISWTGGLNTISYDILRKSELCTGSEGFEYIYNVAVGTQEYLDLTDLQNETDYCYQIKAIGTMGNNFAYSVPSGTSTVDCLIQFPNPPVEIQTLLGESYWESTTSQVSRVSISWSQDTTNAERFLIMRRIYDSGETFAEVGHTPGSEYSYVDYYNLIEDVRYEYRIDAVNDNGLTPGGNLRSEWVPIAPPGPFDLSGEWISGFTKVRLSWTEANTTPIGGAVSYTVLKDDTTAFETTEILGCVDIVLRECTDTSPTFFEPWYIVKAKNAKGKITYSNPVNMYAPFSLIWKEISPQ